MRPISTSSKTQVYRTALYARLSVLDSGKGDGDSIENQIALLEEYVRQHQEMERVELFQDNGYTGTNFDRPAWVRLMESVYRGEIDCIVVKDLSRLGRDYMDVGSLLQKEFPRLGIRFVAINDGYDSENLHSSSEITMALKNIVNDFYAKDISRKVGSALKAKRQNGDFIGDYAPYGYWKDPKNKSRLVVDPETAPVVLKIFQWRAAGTGYTAIARKLNDAGVSCPGRYRYEHGIITNNNKRGPSLLWTRRVLVDILNNIAYIGHLAQGKSAQSLHDGIPFHRTTEDEWDIVYDTHEPIVPLDLFGRVQRLNRTRAAQYKANYGKYSNLPKGENLYGRKLVCADCGYALKLYRNIGKGGAKAWYTYICQTYEQHRERACTKKKISKGALDAAVLASIQAQIALFLDTKQVLERLLQMKHPHKQSQDLGAEITLTKQLKRKRNLLTSLYSDYRNGILTRDEYLYAKQRYGQEVEHLQEELEALQGLDPQIERPLLAANEWSAIMGQYLGATVLTREIIDAFVYRLRLSADNSIDIQFRFDDVFHDMIEAQRVFTGEVA